VFFGSTYRPLWIGLGTVSLDLLFAVLITSLLRRHLGYRAWRATHWAAYAAWPAALLHTLGAGTDVGTGWMRLSVTACVLVVLGAVVVRVGGRDPAARDQARRHRPRALRAQ
jgi:sulfoxide reductase heme-binding subunit YedZ